MYRRYFGAALLMLPWDSIGASGGFVSIFPPDSLGHLPRAPARPGLSLCIVGDAIGCAGNAMHTRRVALNKGAPIIMEANHEKKLSMLGIIVGAALLSAAPF